MSFPVKLKHRGKVYARIYRRPDKAGFRLYWRVRDAEGKAKTRQREFLKYSAAKQAGETLVADLAKGSPVTALTPSQARDAMAALGRLNDFYRETGRSVSLLSAVSDFCASASKLGRRSINEAVDGFLNTVAEVKRVDLGAAVREFIASKEARTIAKPGERSQLSPGYVYIVKKWLEEFADTIRNTAVCDLKQNEIAAYIDSHSEVSARTRNGRRVVTKMFLKWCTERNYLPTNHRLFAKEWTGKETQGSDGEVEFYRPKELRSLIDAAECNPDFRPLVPVVFIGGLGGLRLQEIARLTWEEVFEVRGHIKVASSKSKTKQRRLVEICPALAAWLKPYRAKTGQVWGGTLDSFHDLFNKLREAANVRGKRNGLRHSFCTYHWALHHNSNLTAAVAGNSPEMIHAHYRGLATKSEAKQWFAVKPTRGKGHEKVIDLPTIAES